MTRWLFQAFVVATIMFVGHENAFSSPNDDVAVSLQSASDAFTQQRWDDAIAVLRKAEDQAKAAGSSADKLTAKVLCFGAAVTAAQGQSNKSIAGFRRALKLDPNVKLTKAIATPEVRDAFKKALLLERSAAPLLSGATDESAPAAPTPAAQPAPVPKPAQAPPPPTPVPPPPAPPRQPALAPPPAAPAAAPPPPPVAAAPPAAREEAAPKPEPAAAEPEPTPPTQVAVEAPNPKKAKRSRKKSSDSEEPDLPASLPRPLHCPNPDEAPPGHKAVLRCTAQAEVPIARVLLFYRLPGKESYESVPATKTPRGWYIATVPAEAFSGKSMQYYFDARDETDKSVADNGRFESPNIMIVAQGAPPVMHNALAGVRMEGNSTAGAEVEENPIERFFGGQREDTGRKYWVSLALGRGFGFHGTARLEWYQEDVSGGAHAASVGHLAPEIGVLVASHFALALQVRSQLISHSGDKGTKEGSPAVGANAALLRMIWFLPAGQFSNLQISAIVGAGEGFRLVVPPNEIKMRTSSDTVRGGPWIAGVGVHTDVALTEMWALRLGIQALQGFGNSATVIDFAAGAVAWF